MIYEPVLKMGGIFAGHNYTEQSEPYGASCPQTNFGNEDWTRIMMEQLMKQGE
jgi:hypothetical protein